MRNFAENYYPISIRIIHWITTILFVSTVLIILLRDEIDAKPLRLELLNLHRGLGVSIFLLVLMRLLFRVKHLNNIPDHGLPFLTALASKVAHLAIYLSLLVLPVLGILQTNASGKSASFFGLFPLPQIIQADDDLAEQLQDYHSYLAWVLVALVSVHILAALWHHFFIKDNVFESMKIKFKRVN